jgi:membrane-bound serine protease (ClpP class)
VNRSRLWLLLLLGIALPAYPAALTTPSTDGPVVSMITLHDTLQPARARAFVHEVAAANQNGCTAILVNLSTPGGMSSAVDTMVTAIRSSHVPVIVWTGVEQTRVGGQGLRLIAEADLVYMGQSTYLSPLWADPPRGLKASERSLGSQQLLTQLSESTRYRGRALPVLIDLSSGGRWLNPMEAAEAGLIDAPVVRVEDVVNLANGRMVTRGGKTFRLVLQGAQIRRFTTEGENFLLLSLMNPNLDVLLLTLGLLLIYLEINTPGIVIPGAAGLLLVLLTMFALGSLPVRGLGMSLCGLALALLILESKLHARGILATCGIIALIGGLGTLVAGPIPQLQVAWGTAIGAGIGFGGITAALMVLASEAKRAKVKTGAEAMLGWLAVAQTPLAPAGRILVRGELWNARLTSNDTTVAAGERVKVLRADGLTLEVAAVPLSQSS